MVYKILSKLEDPKRPLLGPNVKALKFWGILLPSNVFLKYFYILMHISVSVFTATEYIDIWFVKSDINLLLNNMKITMLATVSVLKITTFLLWQKRWKKTIEYVTMTDIEQRETDDVENIKIIKRNTKYSRIITYFYWILMYTTVVIVVVQPIYKYFSSPAYRENVKVGNETYLQVVSSWVPFNKNTIPGYLAASFFQTYAAVYGGGWITSFDTNAMVIMVAFKGSLELLHNDSAKIFGTEANPVSEYEAKRRILKCHRQHVLLTEHAQLFNKCLSPIMFLYMLVCSIMLCVTAYQITIETSTMQRFLTTEYLVFGVAQLFMFCWHGNDVLDASSRLMNGPYKSTWCSRSPKIQKELFILTAQFKKDIMFTAGPFSNLTVPSFLNILKGAYSYYTLLSQSQM